MTLTGQAPLPLTGANRLFDQAADAGGRKIAGDTEDAQRIRPVRSDVHIDDRVVEAGIFRRRRARPVRRREDRRCRRDCRRCQARARTGACHSTSTPRITPFSRWTPVPGMNDPAGAKTPIMPPRAFGAPQTTWIFVAVSGSTMQTRRRSAFGCLSAETTRAILKGANCLAGSCDRLRPRGRSW